MSERIIEAGVPAEGRLVEICSETLFDALV